MTLQKDNSDKRAEATEITAIQRNAKHVELLKWITPDVEMFINETAVGENMMNALLLLDENEESK